MAENDSKSSVELATKLVQLGRARDKTETILLRIQVECLMTS